MPMLRSMRLLNSIEAGITDGAALQTLLSDAGRLAEFKAMLQMRAYVRRMTAAPTTMAAIFGSARATEAFFAADSYVGKGMETVIGVTDPALAALPTLAGVAASSTAMASVAANTVIMAGIASSRTAKTTIFDYDVALNAIAASATALAACRAAAGYAVQAWTENNTTPVSLPLTGAKYIVLGASKVSTYSDRAYTVYTRRSGSTISATTPWILSAQTGTTATDVNLAIPITGPYSAASVSVGATAAYLGLLRCDI